MLKWLRSREKTDWLTEVLPAPDVHGGVIFAKVIEPGPVNHKEPACDDGSPVRDDGGRISVGEN